MKYIKIFTFFIFLFPFKLLAQPELQKKYGIGFLLPEKGMNAYSINFPTVGFDLFDMPNGTKTGSIYKKDFANLMFFDKNTNTAYRVDNNDMAEFSRKTFCLKYFENKDGYLKILLNSTGKGLWISEKDLKYLRIKKMSWLEYFIETKEGFYPAVDIGLNLREKPDAKSKKIALLKGDFFYIKLSGKTEGLWAEATVMKYAARPCKTKDLKSLKPVSEQAGWIKIVDDTGAPNIWFHVEGCN